jgi:hypothetical protein
MADIAIEPIVLKNVSLLIPTDNFAASASSVTFTPTSSTVTWTGLGLNTYTGASTATWVCAIDYAQDWKTPGSLSQYLFNNEGNEVNVTFKPELGDGPSFTCPILIVPGAIGGAVNAVSVASVTLPCKEKPTLVPETTPSTTATAGSPGEFDGDTPADLAAMAGILADPDTAWTTGQHVILGDASHCYWSSSAWVAGDAP